MFVNFSGKKELKVNYPISTINEVDNKMLENFSVQINEQMKQYLGENILNIQRLFIQNKLIKIIYIKS